MTATIMTIIFANGGTSEHPIDLPQDPGYDRLKALVDPHLDGGRLERVAVLHDGHACDMFVDDESIAKGLPKNRKATAIYRNNWLTQHPEDDPDDLPAIYGPAVLFSRRVWF